MAGAFGDGRRPHPDRIGIRLGLVPHAGPGIQVARRAGGRMPCRCSTAPPAAGTSSASRTVTGTTSRVADWMAARRGTPRAHHHATDGRHRGVSYPADVFEDVVGQALDHVSANAKLVSDVIGALGTDEPAPDPVTLARIDRDRDAALTRYRRDRDPVALELAMRRLDQEEGSARAMRATGPTPAEAVDYLRDLAALWDGADGSGRRLLAEALFERIDVLGATRVHLRPSASAQAQGWAQAWDGARLVVMVGARGVGATRYG